VFGETKNHLIFYMFELYNSNNLRFSWTSI